MPDYGQKKDRIIIKQEASPGSSKAPGIFLYRSGSLRDKTTAVSASVPQILAVTCSNNTDNVLTKLTTTNAYAYITVSNGNGGIGDAAVGKGFIVDTFSGNIKETRLVLRYTSASYTPKSKLISSSKSKIDHFIDIPIKNNDDSFAVAYKTVNALNKKGQGRLYTASLVDVGNSLSNLSSSLGENMTIGSSFKVRSGSLLSASIDVAGKFTITNLTSGSVKTPDFSGTKTQVGGMKIGSTLKVTDTDPLFKYNIIQQGSGRLNIPFYPGDPILTSQSLSIELDPDDKTSAFISGSGKSKLYFSGSGKIGIGTTDPQKDLDIDGDLNISQNLTISNNLTVEGTITANAYIVTESITTVTSGSTIFGNSADDSHVFTGHITASGDISASGDIIATGNLRGEGLYLDGGSTIFWGASSITDGGNDLRIRGHSSGFIFYTGSSTILTINKSGHITSSHTIKAEHFYSTDDAVIDDNLTVGGDLTVGTSIQHYGDIDTKIAFTADNHIDFSTDNTVRTRINDNGLTVNNGYLSSTTHITSSGNISASGNIINTGHITSSGNISASGTSHTFGANVKISAGTSGDATLTLESDTDNNAEADNPYINFLQDGGDVEGFIGLSGNDGKWPSGESLVNLTSQNTSNALILGTTSSHGDAYRNVILVSRQTASLFVDGGSVKASGDISSETGTILAGWHGSSTRIKILVSDFIPDDIGRPAMIDDTGSDRWLESFSTGVLFASIPIPTGIKATHVQIYGSATSAMTVYEAYINSKTVTSKGTGNIGTELNITDVTSTTTNYLFIELAQASGEEVYGGYVTIATL